MPETHSRTASPFVGPASEFAAAYPTPLHAHLGRVRNQTHLSEFVFGSPLTLSTFRSRKLFLDRFEYFGPDSFSEAPRIAVLAGLGRHDRLASFAVLALVERLIERPLLGKSLNVSFFPVVNVHGLLGQEEERDLSDENWLRSTKPEIRLLAEEVRLRQYHGYIQIVTTSDDLPSALLRSVRWPESTGSSIEVFNSADFAPWDVKFESVAAERITTGPLSLSEDLPVAPFEVILSLPSDWLQAEADLAVGTFLHRLLTRYRSFLAYGQGL